MSIFTVKNGKKTLLRSIYIKILIFIGLICLSAACLQPLQTVLGQEMQNIRSNLIEELEDLTGMDVRYSSIRPAIMGSFDIRNFRLYKNDEPFFTVYRIRINFSLLELLVNRKTFVHTVVIERPVLKINTERDKDTLDFFSSMLETSRNEERETLSINDIADFLPRDAHYQIKNGYFSFTDKDTLYQIDDINLNIHEDEGEIFFDGGLSAEYRVEGFFDRTIILKSNVTINGSCDALLQDGSAEIHVSFITCYEHDEIKRNISFFRPPLNNLRDTRVLFSVMPFNTSLLYEDMTLKVNQRNKNAPYFYFQYNTQTNDIYSEINFEDFRPVDRISFTDSLKHVSHLLEMNINGNLGLRYGNGFMDYKINIKGENNSDETASGAFNDSFFIDVNGTDKIIYVSDFLVSASRQTAKAGLFQGNAGFSGYIEFDIFKPSGSLFFDNFSLGAKDVFSAVFDITSTNREIQISADDIRIADANINHMDIFIYPAQGDIAVSARLFSGKDAAVYLDALINKNPFHLEASLALDSVPLYEITQFISPFYDFFDIPAAGRGFLQESLISTEVFLSTDFNSSVYNAPVISFNLGGTKGFISLSGTGHQINLSEGIISYNGIDLLLSANMNFSNPMDLVFAVNAAYLDLAWHVEGQVIDRTTLIIRDPNGLFVYGNLDSQGAMSGYIEGIDFPVPAGEYPVYLNFYSTLRFSSIDFWNLDVNHFTVREINAFDGMEMLRISGAADQDGASFREIVYNDSEGMLAGSADLFWDRDFSFLEVIMNITDGYEAGEFYDIEGVFIDEKIDVRMTVSNMNLNRFIESNIPVILSADADVSWNSIDSFNAQLNLSSFYTRIQGEQINASVGINFSNDELTVRNLRLDVGNFKTVIPEFQVNRDAGIARARADFQGFGFERNIEGRFGLDVNFRKINSWPEIISVIDDFSGNIFVENLQYGELFNERIEFDFFSKDGSLSVTGGINEMLRLDMEPDGNLFLGLSYPFPIRGAFSGSLDIERRLLDIHCSNYFVDLSALYSLVNLGKVFNIAGGYITGQMDVRGDILSPGFYGTGRGSSIRLQVHDFISEDIRTVPFSILAEGHEMTFGPVDTLCGNGGGSASGWFVFQNWYPVNIGIDINIPANSPIPYNFNITGFLASGNASGNFLITYDSINKDLDLRGNLFTNYAELGMNMDNIASGAGSDSNNSVFNTFVELNITAGSMVEFIWPAANPIIKAYPERGTVINISSDTQSGHYSINSDVRIRSGEIYYFDRSFFIRQGNIILRENESRFNPIFSVRAETKDRADTGPVTISMIVDNQPLLSFEPRFEASPSLTQLEIYSILGQTFNSLQGEDNEVLVQQFLLNSTTDLVTQIIASSDTLSQFVFFRQLERQVRDTMRLDVFSVRTRFVHNVVLSGAAGFSQTPVDRSNRVGNYFDNTTVFIGKYVGQHMFIQGMLTMRYDENSIVFGGLKIEPDIGIELQSPFVTIRWDFFPYHPENFWVNDNSITLSWSMSF
ncbi:MAG: hypothetical protein FWD40_09860 [Treponema sp.]|nr:hypothetical protein [Treponema sp.]